MLEVRRSPSRRRGLSAAGLVILSFLLTGCLRTQVSLVVSADDRISGQIVAAVPKQGSDAPPQLVGPKTLGSKVRLDPYAQDGFVGTRVYFSDLTFAEAAQLTALHAGSTGQISLEFRRAGDDVRFLAKADLSQLPKADNDITVKVAFPEKVTETNGKHESDEVVTWKLASGEVTTMSAESKFADPTSGGFTGWILFVTIVGLLAAGGVGTLAYIYRNPRPASAQQVGQRPENFLTEMADLRDQLNRNETVVAVRSRAGQLWARLRRRGD